MIVALLFLALLVGAILGWAASEATNARAMLRRQEDHEAEMWGSYYALADEVLRVTPRREGGKEVREC